MRLIDMVREFGRRMAIPLAGYPGINLTRSTIRQNEFNAELQVRSLYKLAERIAPDAIFTMMDLSVEAGAMGLPVRYPLSDSATVEWHPVAAVSDLEQYKVLEPMYDARVWVFLETIRQLKAKLAIPVGAYITGPFTLAGLMMGAGNIAMATLDCPEVVHATVNFCERVVIDFGKALLAAGADMICMLDPTAVILSPSAYPEFAGRSVENVLQHLNTRTILHVCGNTTNLIEAMCATGAQGLSLDSMVDFPAVAKRMPSDVVLIGNVDPVNTLLKGSVEKVRHDTRALLAAMAPFENFLPATGCDLPAETPLANIAAFVETVRDWKP